MILKARRKIMTTMGKKYRRWDCCTATQYLIFFEHRMRLVKGATKVGLQLK